jgi:FMN reductase
MNLSVVVGNPKPGSRTLKIARAVACRVIDRSGGSLSTTVDLAEHSDSLFQWPSSRMNELTAAVASSTVCVVASPTYKATYTGLLKSFFDRYPHHGLAGVTAIPVMTGGSMEHAMAVDVNLRALLVELGASVPTAGLFFPISSMPELDSVVDAWAEQNLTAPAVIGPMTRTEVTP